MNTAPARPAVGDPAVDDPVRPAAGPGQPPGDVGSTERTAGGSGRPAAATRGSLVIADRVIEKIVSEALLDVGPVGGLRRRLPGQRRRAAGNGSRPRVSARVGRGTARLSIALSVRYPARIVEICEDVRARVIRQVADLAGLRVTHLDIDVSAFELSPGPDVRVR